MTTAKREDARAGALPGALLVEHADIPPELTNLPASWPRRPRAGCERYLYVADVRPLTVLGRRGKFVCSRRPLGGLKE